jgi:predicted nucleotide-binding protein (sugar kinase/HSP70/actin superfamily)
MQTKKIDHYVAYKPRPFLKQEREQVTILFGGMHWRVERLIQGAMKRLGYNTRVLPTATKEDLLTGRGVADIGQCCPTSFTTGNLANFLRGEAQKSSSDEVARNFVYLTAGSCGACRFGQYHQSYELALKNIGMESFRMFLLSQDELDQGEQDGGGLELDLPFTLGAVWSIIVSDLVQDLEYQTRPYEVVPGETDRVSREAVEYLYEVFRKAPVRGKKWGSLLWYVGGDYYVKALREVQRLFAQIEVDRLRVKPVVKLTGEFYMQTVEGEPNYNIHRWLEAEGAEVYPAPITTWLDYLVRLAAQDFEVQVGIKRYSRRKRWVVLSMQWMLKWTYQRMRHELGDVPRVLPGQRELSALAKPWYHCRNNGGEGDMLVGKALWVHLQNKAHMICELSPYSCMPNTMSVGAMAGVLGRYPDLLYAPLEIKGDAEVHALSRCQMVLTEAKRRAQQEYEDVLEQAGITAQRAQELATDFADASNAGWPVPRLGATGTAANLVLHLTGTRYQSTSTGADVSPTRAKKTTSRHISVPIETRPSTEASGAGSSGVSS